MASCYDQTSDFLTGLVPGFKECDGIINEMAKAPQTNSGN